MRPPLPAAARRRPAPRLAALALALGCALAGPARAAATAPPATAAQDAAALADIGLALLRADAGVNAVAAPLAVVTALGLVHAGTQGAAEREIEALFGAGPAGAQAFRQRLPALLRRLGEPGGAPPPFVGASRIWIDAAAAPAVPAAYVQRLAARYGADAARVNFADGEGARGRINAWTAERTAGRIAELMPPGSVGAATRLSLSTAMHFRSAWATPFEEERTLALPFQTAAGTPVQARTMNAVRSVLQAEVDGTTVLALPFAGEAYLLLLALPAPAAGVQALQQALRGDAVARWAAALQPQRCQLALPRFALAPRPQALRALLEGQGLRTIFSPAADLRPMLGRQARDIHLGEVFHAAGLRIDEHGGEAVAAAAATVQGKSLQRVPACAVDRPFLFVVLHRASGTPLFMGRVDDPTLGD